MRVGLILTIVACTGCIERVDTSTQCFGMHCCPSGFGMRGAQIDKNQLLCRRVQEGHEDCFLDFPTQRQHMHACPRGTYMRGVHADHNVLTCCYERERGFLPLGPETVDAGHQERGMHACPLDRGSDTFMTGIQIDQNRFLCASEASPPPPVTNPVTLDVNPEHSRSFLTLAPADRTQWQRLARNWMWRIFDLPIDAQAGNANAPPTVQPNAGAGVPVEGGVTRIPITFTSLSPYPHTAAAFLMLPPHFNPEGRYPTALVTHGHTEHAGEATSIFWASDHRAAALYLAQQGVIALAPDTATFGAAQLSIPGSTVTTVLDHDQAADAHVLGTLPQMYFLDDLSWLGVLLAQPGVDPDRVFTVGLSLGSYQAMWIAALDERVTGGAMPGDLFLAFKCLNDPIANHKCQTIPGLLSVPVSPGTGLLDRLAVSKVVQDASHRLFEAEDVAALIAPRRLSIVWGTADPFFTDNGGACARSAHDRAQLVYNAFGAPLGFSLITAMKHELDDASAYELIFGPRAPIRRDYGNQCQGMHCCPPGHAMIGVHVDHNQFLCAPVTDPAQEQCIVDGGNQRAGMHACPAGRYMHGLQVDKNQLTCCWSTPRGALGNEAVDTGTQLEDMHGCANKVMTGIRVDKNQLLCADRP